MKKTYLFAIITAVIITAAIVYFVKYKPHDNEANVYSKSSTQNETVESKQNVNNNLKNKMHIITLKTNFGEIQFETYDADAPKTVDNFITLAGKGFYDNLVFHRVIKGFMMQGGDPECNPSTNSGRCGAGGPGYTFADELNPNTESYKAGYKKGVVAMANAGPNTNGSQFFIMLTDYPLPNNYTIFGKVIKGQEVVDAIGNTQTGPNDKPLKPIIMEKVTIETKS